MAFRVTLELKSDLLGKLSKVLFGGGHQKVLLNDK